jgi:predicted Zn-dependent protease
MRLLLSTTLLTFTLAGLLLASPAVPAQDSHLPDIGSSAGEVLPSGPAETVRRDDTEPAAQLRLHARRPVAGGLAAIARRPPRRGERQAAAGLHLLLLRERQINAFATLGGYVAVNAGLILAADREDEVAGVVSHEIAHVTQSHVLRAVERAQKDSIPILLAMIGAIAIAQSAGGNSSDDAAMAALSSGQALLMQRQIDYTRSNESEADRIGIRTWRAAATTPRRWRISSSSFRP